MKKKQQINEEQFRMQELAGINKLESFTNEEGAPTTEIKSDKASVDMFSGDENAYERMDAMVNQKYLKAFVQSANAMTNELMVDGGFEAEEVYEFLNYHLESATAGA
jgi:hypothetical protein